MYGVVEKESTTTLMQVKELMKNQSFKHDNFYLGKQPMNAIRLQSSGNQNTSRPRPIKIESPDEASKWEFIKRANFTLWHQSIFVKPDQSKEKRDQQYALHQKIKKTIELW